MKFVVGDLVIFDAGITQHFRAGFDHHGRTAKIKFDGFRVGMVFEVSDEDDFVDKPGAGACAAE